MSNFPLRYKLSWLPRLLKPSLGGNRRGFLPAAAALMAPAPAATRRLIFIGDISAVANRAAPAVDERLRSLIASADLVIGNCESPVVEAVRKPLGTAMGARHAMTAAFLADTLAAAGIAERQARPFARQQPHARPGHRRICRDAAFAGRAGHRHRRHGGRRACADRRSRRPQPRVCGIHRMAQCKPPGICRTGDDARRSCTRRLRRAGEDAG